MKCGVLVGLMALLFLPDLWNVGAAKARALMKAWKHWKVKYEA